jgi:hypothetical protein
MAGHSSLPYADCVNLSALPAINVFLRYTVTTRIVLYQQDAVEEIVRNVNVTTFISHCCKDVDGRDKPGHDGI